ncbi:DUF3014 domain-containing protein [Echinimonas agarilytica]|uniref:DUF3014 domain-containing protein n=1 Tax=Echinimonas agarilytica TaxID=1215918 RepID=A0AA41W911_9GAMM|nr:DUF3014 domain-containing protein [Echinimonas agarilytica]MCM2681320.1 DUF3014 domain-containing protein [Echinimonas agarilytica]
MNPNLVRLAIGTTAIVVVGVSVWWFADQQIETAPVQPELPTIEEPALPPEPVPLPDIEEVEVIMPAPEPERETSVTQLEPVQLPEPVQPEPKLFDFVLPTLESSDATLMQQLRAKIASKSIELLADEGIIERFVATIDSISRDNLTFNQLPVERPVGQYKVIEAKGNIYGSTANIARYQPYLDLATSMSREHWIDLYTHVYPLLQNAYENLGYPDQQFHDTLLQALEVIKSSQKPSSSIALTQPNVMFEYADLEMQESTPVNKLMLRVGPEMNQKFRLLLEGLSGPLQQWQPPALSD